VGGREGDTGALAMRGGRECYHRVMGKEDKPQSQSPPPPRPKPGPSGLPLAPPRVVKRGL